MTFDRIDRAHRPKPSNIVRLECTNCGCTGDDVEPRYPLWPPTPPEPACAVPLCFTCAIKPIPREYLG